MKWLYDAITMGNPLNYKLLFCWWTLNTIRTLLEKERIIKLAKSSVCRLLSQLGLSPQRPLYKSYKQNPEKVKSYLAETYPEAVVEAKNIKHVFVSFLSQCGLKTAPKLAVWEDALGFWKAVTKLLPQTDQQRCWLHKTANELEKLPKAMQPKVKEALHNIWQAETRLSSIWTLYWTV